MTNSQPPSGAPNFRRLLPLAGAGVLLLAIAGVAAVGTGEFTFVNGATVLQSWITAGLPAALYVGGALGLGALWRPWLPAQADPASLRAALGLATMLFLSHALGVLGAFGSALGQWIALAPVALGLALLAREARSFFRRDEAPKTDRPSWTWLTIAGAALVSGAVLLVASSNPPGWLWDSEFGGFDSRSYHLPLPQEWYLQGRLWPTDHNVYSFFPGSMEAAFLHLAALTAAPRQGPYPGLLADGAWRLLSCQMLHAGLTVLAAWTTARAARHTAQRAGLDTSAQHHAGWLAGAVFLSIPWTVVSGSLSYNEMPMLAMIGPVLVLASATEATGWRQGVMLGVLIAAATSVKLNALAFVGLPAAVLFACCTRPARWPVPVLTGVVALVLSCGPWLIRNHMACGNPLFPAALSLGTPQWDADQARRFADAHQFTGSVVDRLRLLVLPDPTDPVGMRHRGMMHPQWAWLFPTLVPAAAAALARTRTRRAGGALVSVLALQVLLWLFTMHLQSRFLLPLLPGACVLLGLASVTLAWTRGLGALAACAWSAALVTTYAQQRGGEPNKLLSVGPTIYLGEPLREELARANASQRAELEASLTPEGWWNLIAPPGASLLLVGDATPLYFSGAVTYNTTFDSGPLDRLWRNTPPSPSLALNTIAELRRRGITHVLVNASELARYQRSGWLQPSLEPARVLSWADATLRPVKDWGHGVRLYELPPLP